jgi:hypothetical protein
MREEFVCFLNTKSEICCVDWLSNLAQHLVRPGVGLVGNTGSYESAHHIDPTIPEFPNPHIRTNAFLIRRELFSRIVDPFEIRTKLDGCMVECGPNGLSQQVLREGLQLLVIDRNGQAFEPARWEKSGTYCTRDPAPLIGDDTYRKFLAADSEGRRDLTALIWGPPAEEARVRARYKEEAEKKQRETIAAAGKPSRLLSRLLRLLTTEKQFQALKRSYRAVISREHSRA